MNIQKILLTSFSLLGLISCGERSNDPVQANAGTLSVALEESVNNSLFPAVEGFSLKASQFNDQVSRFCTTTNSSHLATLQQSWKSLSKQWYKLEVYNFGPLNDDIIFPKINFIDSLRQRGIDYTDTVRDEISNGISRTKVLNETFFANKDFNRVGLLPLELMVFETAAHSHSKLTQDIVAEYVAVPRKCEYLKGISSLNLKNANYIHQGWQSNHLDSGKSYKSLFLNNQLANGDKPIPTMITAIQTHLDYLAKRNVAIRGAQTADYSYENIRSSIDEINSLLNGTGASSVSFFDLMMASGAKNSVDQVKSNISAVYQSIQNEDAVQLKADLGKLDGNFKREIPSGLDVELGINFTDGD